MKLEMQELYKNIIAANTLPDAATLNQGITEEGDLKGATLLWRLSANREGLQFLNQLAQHDPAATIELLMKCDLNAVPIQGPDQGKTVLWSLSGSLEGQQFLNQLAQHCPAITLQLLQRYDLNAAPDQGPNQGVTVLWWLAINPEGRELIKKLPALIFCYATLDQNVTDAIITEWESSPDPEINTFKKLFILAGVKTASPSSNQTGWRNKLLVLAGIIAAPPPPRLDRNIAKNYNSMKDKIFNEIDNCIRFLWIEKNWQIHGVFYMQLKTLHQHIINSHPDLYFIDDKFLELLVANRLAELDPNFRLRQLAMLCVKEYRMKYKGQLAFMSKTQIQSYHKIVLTGLKKELAMQNIHPFELTEQCREMIINEASDCVLLNEYNVATAINTAIRAF